MKSFKLVTLIVLGVIGLKSQAQNSAISLPLAGNAYSSLHQDSERTLSNKGIVNWTNPKEYFTAYFRVSKPGTIVISLVDKPALEGQSTLEFTINNQPQKVSFDETKAFDGEIGEWTIKDTGYVAIVIKGISKSGAKFPSIQTLTVGGTATEGKTAYVKNNEGNFFHWGRRGPSVHLNYQQPENVNAEWYYNEVTVPKGEDILGSYFMACGFGEGYFGMQVNSPTERHILFSVWSPFNTDDPKSIPESHKIKMLKKGEGVHTGEFGNEGAGGQSYLNYLWKAGNTYKFLLHGVPGKDSVTTYTAYFFAPETNKWQLIASFSRPQTKTYLKRFHSFLENFSPVQGDLSRKVLFDNQWICDDKGVWSELKSARFTTDNTGAKGYRVDYQGGTEKGAFYLKNGGFFNDYTTPRKIFTRTSTGKKPEIDFSKLP
ncbi:DUF3472 domain-containing protein [Pedobacter jeongneungensis]|uniref:DUF3472 domain-containing protein n=1 Tax=Pedobacter jeongneungensis TaxID=947309 RepID=UPI00046A731C|nr:DUF3472 domain-containing protein [Pedobacter jeongneungensis]